VAKRSITIAGHRTSISLEQPFWDALAEIAESTDASVASIVAAVDRGRGSATSLSGALRLHVLDWYRQRAPRRQR
jgi:predicted DNA-binding ribbon-helix-helix protein